MNYPKVSIIIPTYNRANLLSRAIKSILNQTFKDFELIIVDDGSTDNTRQVVEKFQKEDSRIKYIWQENSGAPARPKNTGIKNSTGEYIAFLDDDDEWLPEKLEKQLKLFENSEKNNLGFVGCNFYINEDNKTKLYKIPKMKNVFKNLLEGVVINGSSGIMIKKLVIGNVGLFDENFKSSEDWDLWIRISQKYDFDFIKEFLFKRYFHGGNLTKTGSYCTKIKELKYLLEKYQSSYKKFPIIYSKILRNIGTIYLLDNNINLARKHFIKSIKTSPFYLRNYINFLISLFGISFYKKLLLIKQKLIETFISK